MIIKDLTILTLNEPNVTDFSQARNQLLATAQTDWVLFLDQDETLTPALTAEINAAIHSRQAQYYSAYSLKRQDIFLGRPLKYGETGNASFIRLAKRDWGHWEGRVHEKWLGNGPVGNLHSPIIHTPHPSLSSFVNKIDLYSTLAAEERKGATKHVSLMTILIYPLGKFLSNYLLRLGFLDGVAGLIHALMMSWHSYLTHAKHYLLCRKK